MADETLEAGSGLDRAASAFTSLLFPEEAQQPVETPTTDAQADVTATEEATSEAAPADADEAEATEATQDAPQPKRSRKLRIGDEEVEVDEDEAYNGYLRTADYTRKSQQNADLRKKAEAELAEARKAREQYAGSLEQVANAMDQWVPKEPNWSDLARSLKPEQYVQAQAEWQEFQKNRRMVAEEQDRVAKERLSDLQKEREATLAQEQEKLLEVLPDWRDPAKAQSGRQELVGWLKSKGYTEEQIGGIADHRLIVALRNAKQFEDLQSKKPAATQVKSKMKTATPGSPPAARKPSTDRDRDLQQLKKSGKMDDAARAFSHFVE